MKQILIVLVALCPIIANADDKNTKYTWSYGALADTMKDMRRNCEITSAAEFTDMGNWMRQNGSVFSVNELSDQCLRQQHKFNEIDRSYVDRDGVQKKCELPTTNCNAESCGEIKYTSNKGCNIFITTFIKNNNLRSDIMANKNPGTYVKKSVGNNGESIYQVFDVVLAKGYWDGNKINNAVNNAAENTKVYEITDSGEIVDTGMRTWTNDMFFDVEAKHMDLKGDVRGATVRSYILPHIDLTSDIYALYDARRGLPGAFIGNGIDSRQNGPFDIKAIYSEKYKIAGQQQNEPATNGVLFSGKIANLDWLGHFLYGMNRSETIMPDGIANGAAQLLSVVGSLKQKAVKPEPLNLTNAWSMGDAFVEQNKSKRNMTFAKIKTDTEQKAYQMASNEMKKIYPNAKNISCVGNCNTRVGADDIVICVASNNLRMEFVFDSICNVAAVYGNTYSGPGIYFKPGMK